MMHDFTKEIDRWKKCLQFLLACVLHCCNKRIFYYHKKHIWPSPQKKEQYRKKQNMIETFGRQLTCIGSTLIHIKFESILPNLKVCFALHLYDVNIIFITIWEPHQPSHYKTSSKLHDINGWKVSARNLFRLCMSLWGNKMI